MPYLDMRSATRFRPWHKVTVIIKEPEEGKRSRIGAGAGVTRVLHGWDKNITNPTRTNQKM